MAASGDAHAPLAPEPDRPAPRREVVDGCLVLAPGLPAAYREIRDRLRTLLDGVLPPTAMVRSHTVVRLPDGDAAEPDLVVATGGPRPPELPARRVHTVVEVVVPAARRYVRVRKRALYEAARIPCFWRVELEPWPGYRGPLPVVAVRIREGRRWRELVAPAGRERELPVAVSQAEIVTVRFDPAVLAATG
jgi:Putative restriction endonuclease